MRDDPLVRLKGLHAWYEEDRPPILQGIDLEIDEGQLVLLLGPSGAGKSTLGLCLTGIIPHVMGAMSGHVEIDGLSVGQSSVAEIARKVGMIFQDIESMLAMLYVRDEISFGPENLALPREEIDQRVQEALSFVNLLGLEERFVYELSGGQKQKVAIASVLAMRPPVLFLDEPLANLDPRTSAEVLELVTRLAGDHTILLFDHKVDEVSHMVDRVIVLDQGQVVADGEPREIFRLHGKRLVEQLGIWVPQLAEVSIHLMGLEVIDSATFAMNLEEGIREFGDLEYLAEGPLLDGVGEFTEQVELPTGDLVIQVENVSFTYPSGVEALRDVTFDITRGEMVALLGPNGSGKTTLSKHIVGLLKPNRGRLLVEGMDTRDTPTPVLTQRVGFVFQHPDHQFVRDTVWEEVAFSLEVRGVAKDKIEEAVAHELAVFGLEGFEDRLTASLSAGQKRRLSVATILIAQPDIVVLDEPTYGQDRANTEAMMNALLRATAEIALRPTIILVTHDMKLVAQYADRALVMRAGILSFDGSVFDLFQREDLVSWANLEDPPILQLCRRLRANGKVLPGRIRTPLDFARSVVSRVPEA